MTTAPGQRAAVDLAAVREQWGDLLAAIEQRPAAEWPPRECAGFLDQLAAQAADDIPADASIGRIPLTLREHPAPLNLTALDAAIEVESALFDLADQVAEQVQRAAVDQNDRDGLARWRPAAYREALLPRPARVLTGTDPRTPEDREAKAAREARHAEHRQAQGLDREPDAPPRPPAERSGIPVAAAGSRAYGLHWAAVWLEGRALDEPAGDLFRPLPPLLLDHVTATATRARRSVERALGRDRHTVPLDPPCPYCRGPLTGQSSTGNVPEVYCGRGEACPAPGVLDHRRRVWRGAALVDLWTALNSTRREAPAA